MRDGVRRAQRVPDAVAQPHAAGVEEGKQRGVAGEEEFLADVGVGGRALGLREVGEEVLDGFEGEALGGDLGGERVVEELDCVVEGADLGL